MIDYKAEYLKNVHLERFAIILHQYGALLILILCHFSIFSHKKPQFPVKTGGFLAKNLG
jgi:hypothetical protein